MPPDSLAEPEVRQAVVLKALDLAGVSVLYCDGDLRIGWVRNPPLLFGSDSLIGSHLPDFLSTANSERLLASVQDVRDRDHQVTIELSVPSAEGDVWFAATVDRDRSSTGATAEGLIIAIVEITEQKRREQTLRTLLREVAHRSKNLLAIIQSIAFQTGRHVDTVDAFLSRFRGRVQSLASTQDLVTSSNWRGANLSELLCSQLSRYAADTHSIVRLKGENPYFNPNAAVHIGLALHELIVNSISYGALSRPDGYADLQADFEPSDGGDALVLVWSESIRIKADDVGQKRFGSVALERVVPASLGGNAELTLTPDQLIYRLHVPRSNFAAD